MSILALGISAALSLACFGREKSIETYGAGLNVRVPASEAELLQSVQEVASDGIIQGSKEYSKDEYILGAEAVESTRVFTKWGGPGHVFYKVRENALDPRNFKDGGDSGTLAVRYVVQSGDEKSTLLKIDAIYVDDMHRRPHASNGSVEAAEYAAIQQHLATMHLQKQEAAEKQEQHHQEVAATQRETTRAAQKGDDIVAKPADITLAEHVKDLRQQVERTVKAPGAQLRSAPFRSASSIKPLVAGAQVVILISTRYWYGVETQSGEHGWLHRSEVERLP